MIIIPLTINYWPIFSCNSICSFVTNLSRGVNKVERWWWLLVMVVVVAGDGATLCSFHNDDAYKTLAYFREM